MTTTTGNTTLDRWFSSFPLLLGPFRLMEKLGATPMAGAVSIMHNKFGRRITGALILLGLSLVAMPAVHAQEQGEERISENEARIRRLERTTPMSSTNYRQHYELGNAYYDSGEFYVEAEERYRRAIELNKKFIRAYVNLGALVEQLDRAQEAVDLLKEALKLDPDDCRARSNLGNVYYAMEKYPDAMYEFKRALQTDPECYTALFNIGVAFADVGIYREAVTYWKEVVRIAPNTDAARQATDNIEVLEPLINGPAPPSIEN